MKYLFLIFLLALGHNPVWAKDISLDNVAIDEETFQNSETQEAEPESMKFSHLVKSTMELLGPESSDLEYSHATQSQVINQ